MTNEKAIMCLEDMKIKVPIPKAAKQARENNEALDVAIKALKAEPHWIPVTERLPETELQHPGHGIGDYLKSDMVAVSGDFDYGDKVWIACYCDDLDGKTYWSDMDANTLYNVIAWMPLPEPYKGVTDGRD